MYDATGFLVVKDHIFIARGGSGDGLHLLSSEDQGLTFHPIRFPLGLKESVCVTACLVKMFLLCCIIFYCTLWYDTLLSSLLVL